jgi:hypothetical protein
MFGIILLDVVAALGILAVGHLVHSFKARSKMIARRMLK